MIEKVEGDLEIAVSHCSIDSVTHRHCILFSNYIVNMYPKIFLDYIKLHSTSLD
jgi:hypothetical protein